MSVWARTQDWCARWWDAAVGLVYPPTCLACEDPLTDHEHRFCAACLAEMCPDTPTCVRCGVPVGPYVDTSAGCLKCRHAKFRFESVTRAGVYDGSLRLLCLRLKSQRNEFLGRVLADLLWERQGERLRAVKPDCVVGVPLHWARRLRRGFNQADVLARRLAGALQVPHRSRILSRTRQTAPQARLGVTDREGNVRDAFRARPKRSLQGATVLLVDDILTTGATCSEAARVLRAAGAAAVHVAVVARA